MSKQVLEIKFKNNRKKEYKVLFKVMCENKEFIVYTLDEINNDEIICYAGLLNNNEIKEVKSKRDKELIKKVLENFNKGV